MRTQRSATYGGTTILGLVALGLLAFMGLMAYGLVRQNTGRGGIATNEVGQLIPVQAKPASDFRLPLFSGQTLNLSELRGRPVVVNFWASWCPPCRTEAPTLEKSYQTYKDRVTFVGVDIWDSDSAAQTFLRDFGITYPNGPNPRGDIPVEYGVTGIPETYIINAEGTLVKRWIGPLNEAQFSAIVKEVAGE